MKRMQSRIVMVGPFPPPIHGMAAINASVLDHLRTSDISPLVMDLSAKNLDRRFLSQLSRLFKVLCALVRFFATRNLRGAILYMSVSGGLGKIYEIGFAMLARFKEMRIFLHHHSFAYLDRYDAIAYALINTAGFSSVQIVLSAKMAERLTKIYKAAKTVSISNAVFCVANKMPPHKPCFSLQRIGFIGNISIDKGVLIFLDLMKAIEAENLSLRAMLAGPFTDVSIERTVQVRLSTMHTVEYVGPKFGTDKNDFFNDIDVFVFPTQYANEAEPLTVLEAMSHGVPVITYGRGCIPEILTEVCGKVIDTNSDFSPAALAQIKAWLRQPKSFQAASHAATRRFLEIYIQNRQRWSELLHDLLNGRSDASNIKFHLEPFKS
jgi:glycosyltransferase involved in cell wall biosynthesis